ncbi:MAG: HIT domain-containing protein [Chloroherpetonaceae bacterium]|nr:HIT domain-containing protein [Chloroherpetonaceae bacterium]
MENMYSPWRSSYIDSFKEPNKSLSKSGTPGKSIFADIKPEEDEERWVVYRGNFSFIIMNLYPYNAGHLMVIPYKQTPTLYELNDSEKLEVMKLIEVSMKALEIVLKPHGFNVGLNLGQVAGGSVSEHLHFHIVPRWGGDTNFMPVIAETKVISTEMKSMYYKLRDTCKELAK